MKRMIVLGALCWSCGAPTEPRESPAPEPHPLSMAVAPEPEAVAVAPEESPDPYAQWAQWCEPFDYDYPCKTHEDCAEVYPAHPAHRPMKCLNPWYANSRPDYKVCAPGHPGRGEQSWRQARLREVIRQQYFGETDTCKQDGRPMWKESWRCQQATAQGDKLLAFLWVGYMRETTARPWKRHRLDADVKASKTAWFKMAEDYGWSIGAAQGEVASMTAADGANPYYGERYRWHYGLGPLGQNAPLWVHNWDPQAPPEILCREVEPFEAYLRRARAALTTLRQGIRCGGEYYEDKSPSWETLHRVVNLGSMCPPSTDRHRRGLERFRKHADGVGLQPDEIVTRAMLGEPIPVEGQNERVAEIYAVLERELPTMQKAQ